MNEELDVLVHQTDEKCDEKCDGKSLPSHKSPTSTSTSTSSILKNILLHPLLPTPTSSTYPFQVMHFFKWLVHLNILLPLSYYLLHSFPSLDQNHQLHLSDLYSFQYHTILLDALSFYIIGRLSD
ncbi:hypothetical protein TrRE_jg4603, partial [Triparma retinervis]